MVIACSIAMTFFKQLYEVRIVCYFFATDCLFRYHYRERSAAHQYVVELRSRRFGWCVVIAASGCAGVDLFSKIA